MLFDRLGVARLRRRRLVHQPGRLARNTLASRTCGATASPATCRSCSCASRRRGASLPLVRQLLLAQEYWRVKGLRADVVILNEHPATTSTRCRPARRLVQEPRWAGWRDKPGGMFLLRADGMPEADRHLLGAVARVVLRGELGDLRSSSTGRRRGCTTGHDVPLARRCAPRSRPTAGARARRSSWRTGSAASRPTAASTSSCSRATARRRCPGRT
jgi:hypothetical protein